jgi:transcriptional regulator with XRE-family HTH domain
MTETEHKTGPLVRIRDMRLAHGLTGPQLAERIAEHGVNVSADSIYNVEGGNKRASHALMVAWAKALGVHPLDVIQPAVKQASAA